MESLDLKKLKSKNFHFIGIGGISMSALAQMLQKEGYHVQGSDIANNAETEILKKKGIKVFKNHLAENLRGVDVVVYTSAIHADNPELSFAKENGLLLIKRAELLGAIADGYKTVIAVAGSHGKTTTTAMLSEIFIRANTNPTIHVGGPLKLINSNYKVGRKKYFITEACEYMDNFLYIKPDIAVSLNIDSDHLDYFGSLENVKKSFKRFTENIKEGGVSVCCHDDKNSTGLLKQKNISTFGLTRASDIYAKNIKEYKTGYFSFDAYLCGHRLGNIELNIMGKHNVYNALASIIVSLICGIDFCEIKLAIENFSGVGRRCEKVGEINGAIVFHDYAHHPAQIEKMITLGKDLASSVGRNLIAVYEPHTYSRTKFLLEDFAKSFNGADHLIFAPAYSAREAMSEGYEADVLAEKTQAYVDEVEYIEGYDNIYNRIKKLAKPNDIIMILGAGTIEHLAEMFKS